MMSPSINEDDISSTEERAAWKIAEALGVRVDRCRAVVDSYGADHALAALQDVQRQLQAGHRLTSPIAVMIANLRHGSIQVEVAATPDPGVEWARRRWHDTLANPSLDCAQKRLARACGEATVGCSCGCGQAFAAAVV